MVSKWEQVSHWKWFTGITLPFLWCHITQLSTVSIEDGFWNLSAPISNNNKTMDASLNEHWQSHHRATFCWETLDPGTHVDANKHKPSAQTRLQIKYTLMTMVLPAAHCHTINVRKTWLEASTWLQNASDPFQMELHWTGLKNYDWWHEECFYIYINLSLLHMWSLDRHGCSQSNSSLFLCREHWSELPASLKLDFASWQFWVKKKWKLFFPSSDVNLRPL